MNQVHDVGEHARIGLGQHSVPKVEHVAAGLATTDAHVVDLVRQDVRRREDGGRVEVALDRTHRADPPGGLVQRDPPVHPDDIRAGLRHGAEQFAGVHPEVDARDAGIGECGKHALAVRKHITAVVDLVQYTGPRVEQLDGADARLNLDPQVADGDVGEPSQQLVPQPWLGVHELLGAGIRPAGTALDQVTGKGERRAGETDQRDRPELADERADGVGHIRHVIAGDWPQPAQRRSVTDRIRDDRADTGDDVDVHTNRDKRQDDVGEQDRGVGAETPHRLQSDLGHHGWIATGVEHGDVGPQPAILRQRAAGLPHEPHWRALGGLASTRPQEQRIARFGLSNRRARGFTPGHRYAIHGLDGCMPDAPAAQTATSIAATSVTPHQGGRSSHEE